MKELSSNRREFVAGAAAASLGLGMFAEELFADAQTAPAAGPPVTCAVIGLGVQGREILSALAKIPGAPVSMLSETYTGAAYVKRATDIAPGATVQADYKAVLADKAVQAVLIATPSHLHKQIALDAIAAGKHVYCEAPLATDLAEAKAIALAARDAKTVFQVGLNNRCNKMHLHVRKFVLSGALGRTVGGRTQYHRKGGWKRGAPTGERERELNWRLFRDSSSGIAGEYIAHQFDVATWFLKQLPVAVSGMGSIQFFTSDGMEVPDTVQGVIEYPGGIRIAYDGTIANSFDGIYEALFGSDCAMQIRDQRAWMYKETDSPLLGWEVYARKDKIGDNTGIALVADSTQLLAQGKEPGKVGTDLTKNALFYALESFVESIRTSKPARVSAIDGYQAAVVGRKAHEASLTNTRIVLEKSLFEL